MGPETVVYPTQEIENAARQNFDGAMGEFSIEFANGHNWWSGILDRVRRVPTSRERIVPLTERVRASKAFLAEIIGRRRTPPQPTDPAFIDRVSTEISAAHVELGNEIIESVEESTHGYDPLGVIYRSYLQSDGARVFGGALLYAAANGLSWITGENSTLATEGAVLLFSTGFIDLTRRGFLNLTTRHLIGLPLNTAEILRRRASVAEGVVSGDFIDLPPVSIPDTLSAGVQANLEADIRDQLSNVVGVVRPAVVPLGNVTWAPAFRARIRPALDRADETQALVASRENAKMPRLARTLLALGILSGVVYAHLTRPETCGVTTFPQASDESQARFGQPDRLSMSGKTEEYAFKARYGHSFDRKSQWDQEHIALDRAETGYENRITSMAQELRVINPGLNWVDEDRFVGKGEFFEPCPPGKQRAFQRLHPQIIRTETGGFQISFR